MKRRATAHGGGAEESKAVLRAPELHDGGGGGGGGAGGPYGPDGPEGRAMYGAEAQRRKIGRARGGGLRDHSIAMGTAPAGVDESAAAGCSPTRSGAIAGVQDYGVGRWRDGGVSRVVRNPGAGRPVPATTDRRQRGLGHAASTGLRIAAAALFLGTALVWWVGGPSELLRMAKGGQAFAARRNGYDAQKAAQAWMDGLPPVRVAATSPDPMHPEWDAAGWRASERFDGAKPRVAPAVTLVTAAAASQWAQLVNLVGSIHAHDAAARVVVWDMGLLAYQQAAITCWEGVVLRKFPYSSYPPHVKVAYTQAATAMVWRETAAAFPDDDWLWLDPAMEVRGGLDAVRLAIARDGFFLAAAMHGDAAAGSGLDPHPSMVSALGLSNSDAAALGARPRVSPRVLGLGAASRTIHVPAYTPPEGLAPTHPGAARNGGGTELWARRGAGVHGTGLALAGTAREPTWTAIEVLPDDVPLGDVGTGEVRRRVPHRSSDACLADTSQPAMRAGSAPPSSGPGPGVRPAVRGRHQLHRATRVNGTRAAQVGAVRHRGRAVARCRREYCPVARDAREGHPRARVRGAALLLRRLRRRRRNGHRRPAARVDLAAARQSMAQAVRCRRRALRRLPRPRRGCRCCGTRARLGRRRRGHQRAAGARRARRHGREPRSSCGGSGASRRRAADVRLAYRAAQRGGRRCERRGARPGFARRRRPRFRTCTPRCCFGCRHPGLTARSACDRHQARLSWNGASTTVSHRPAATSTVRPPSWPSATTATRATAAACATLRWSRYDAAARCCTTRQDPRDITRGARLTVPTALRAGKPRRALLVLVVHRSGAVRRSMTQVESELARESQQLCAVVAALSHKRERRREFALGGHRVTHGQW